MEKQKETFSQLLHTIDPTAPSSPPLTPPSSFIYVPETTTLSSNFIPNPSIDPYSCSPPKSFTTSAPVKAETFDELFQPNINTRKSLSTDPKKSIRLSSKPSKISYIELDNEPDLDMQTQNPTKRLKTSAFLPYDRKEAQKEKMLEDIVSPINIKTKMITNPYLTNPAPEIVARPLCESKSFDFEDMKSRKIMLDKVMNCIGWKTFCELDEVIYPSLVQKFYSSAKILEGHDIILCEMNQTQVIITTDVLAKVFNLPNSGVNLYGKRWYVKAKVNRNAVINKVFQNVKPAKDFPVTSLKNEFKILHNLCAHSLLPRSRNRYRVNDNDLMILHHLSSGQRVNLPYVIIRHMTAALKDTSGNGGLPYAMALTKIFKEFKLSFIGEKAIENQKPFNCKNVSHLKIHEDSEALGIHQVSLPEEAFLVNEEEENPLFNLVNAVVVESHLSSPSASLHVPKYHHLPAAQIVSTDLTLSLGEMSNHHLSIQLLCFKAKILLCLAQPVSTGSFSLPNWMTILS